MAHVDELPEAALDAVAQGLSAKLPEQISSKVGSGKCEMTESFPVWMLGLSAIKRAKGGLTSIAENTHRWHHQISCDGHSSAFARSKQSGTDPRSRQITQVTASPISEKIENAVQWIDEHAREDPLVRLLIVPAYYLHCFWLQYPDGTSKILVVDRPKELERLSYRNLFDATDFLKLLANMANPAGVPEHRTSEYSAAPGFDKPDLALPISRFAEERRRRRRRRLAALKEKIFGTKAAKSRKAHGRFVSRGR